MIARWPGLTRRLGLALTRLDPRSRLRRTLLGRQVVLGWAASERRDFDLMFTRYSPGVEYHADSRLRPLGLPEITRGREAMLASINDVAEAWERWEFEPQWMLDTGERLVVLGNWRLFGRASGVELEQEFAQLIDWRSGVVTSERDFGSWDAALEAAGLDHSGVGSLTE